MRSRGEQSGPSITIRLRDELAQNRTLSREAPLRTQFIVDLLVLSVLVPGRFCFIHNIFFLDSL